MAEKCLDYNKKAVFHFTDIDKYWTIHIRRGIAEVQPFAMTEPDLEIETTSFVWKEILAEIRNPVKALATGEIKVKRGGVTGFATFMGKFERN